MSVKYRNSNGQETIIAGLTPGGDLEAGAVATQKKTVTIPALAAGGSGSINVVFDNEMPDDDYLVEINGNRRCNFNVDSKTKTGFVLNYLEVYGQTVNESPCDIVATKTYTVQHAAQNAEDIAALKQATPAGAGPSNKFATANDITRVENSVEDISEVIDSTASITNKLVSKSTMDTALGGKQDTLTFDNTPTAGSENPVKSNGIYAADKAIQDQVDIHENEINDIVNYYGSKNLIPYPYYYTTKIINNVTFTVYDDGRVIVNGTASAEVNFVLKQNNSIFDDQGKSYILTGRPSTGITGICSLYIGEYYDSSWHFHSDTNGSGVGPFTYNNTRSYDNCAIYAPSGTVFNNAVFYPMLRLASIKDATYEPYAKTNKQLTNDLNNIAAQTPNPNLFDNPYFTINQRGLTTLSSAGYMYDRWKMSIDIGTMNATDDGLELDATSNAITLFQGFEKDNLTYKKIFEDAANNYTWSMDFTVEEKPSDNAMYIRMHTNVGGQSSSLKTIFTIYPNDVVVGQRYITSGTIKPGYTISNTATNLFLAWLYLRKGWKITIHSFKCEKGSISTLAMDTIPNYQQELAKCQRYFVRYTCPDNTYMPIAFGRVQTATEFRCPYILSVPMRAKPTVTISDFSKFKVYTNTHDGVISSITVSGIASNQIALSFGVSGFTAGEIGVLSRTTKDEYIDFSAEIL